MYKEESNITNFEQRKRDHIELALDGSNQTEHLAQFDSIHLQHEALPEIDFDEVSISTKTLGNHVVPSPFFISSMTAGHKDSLNLNHQLAECADHKGWLMGVGSQRRELFDTDAGKEWKTIRKVFPNVKLLANIGLSQLIKTPVVAIERICENMHATALIIHSNPLQEVIQPEGTPFFRGGLAAIENICSVLSLPVILKETGSGFSLKTLHKLANTGLKAVDISGTGGTHWGRIEGGRCHQDSIQKQTAQTFKDWGNPTISTLYQAHSHTFPFELWGSGGIRNGLQAAKAIALGANMVGLAKPILESALKGTPTLIRYMDTLEYELKVALFCTGNTTIEAFRESQPWR